MNTMQKVENALADSEIKIGARGVQVYYGTNHALKDVDVDIADKTVTAFIGPSGCGKSNLSAMFEPDERYHRRLPR